MYSLQDVLSLCARIYIYIYMCVCASLYLQMRDIHITDVFVSHCILIYIYIHIHTYIYIYITYGVSRRDRVCLWKSFLQTSRSFLNQTFGDQKVGKVQNPKHPIKTLGNLLLNMLCSITNQSNQLIFKMDQLNN